jgi:hypothetical protein
MNSIKKYYSSQEDFNKFYYSMKLIQCPFCHLIGTLILHGYLRGYDESYDSNKITRGRRIFCSNRKKKNGCGRTFSILLSFILKKFNIHANSLWSYLKSISDGSNKKKGFESTGLNFSNTSIYRLYNHFKNHQTHIRINLLKKCKPPPLPDTINPVVQTIKHLQKSFKCADCPIIKYQETFQASFL